jgi:hypothetical protein
MWRFAGGLVVVGVVLVGRRDHVRWNPRNFLLFEIYFRVCCGKTARADPLWERCTRVPNKTSILSMKLQSTAAIVGDGFDREGEFYMHDWMIGLGFIVILIAPCVIAMRTGVEHTDDR